MQELLARLPEPPPRIVPESGEGVPAGVDGTACWTFAKKISAAIQHELRRLLVGIDPALESHADDVGLFIRPILFRIGAGNATLGVDWLLPLSAIELLQQSTLIVDDVLDDAPLRNGASAVWTHTGPKAALCLGHEVLLAGLQGLSRAAAHFAGGITPVVELTRALQVGYQGQRLDVGVEPFSLLPYDTYRDLIMMPTQIFLEASLVAGALASDAGDEVIAALRRWASLWGVAYQMRDDLLDYCESEDSGKLRFGDLRSGKLRLPVILALKNASAHERTRLLELVFACADGTEASLYVAVQALAKAEAFVKAAKHIGSICYEACEQLGPPLSREQIYMLSVLALETAHFILPVNLTKDGVDLKAEESGCKS